MKTKKDLLKIIGRRNIITKRLERKTWKELLEISENPNIKERCRK